MICQQCGAAIGELTRFCSDCGHKVQKSCPSCAVLLDVTAKFCSECGTAQFVEPAKPRSRPELVVADPATDQAEYRQVTVMFCDMVGSTELSERLDAEDLRHVHQTLRTACIETIEGLGGHIDKYAGDGVMALFGFPIAYEDAPKRSALAALELLRQVEALNEDHQEAFGITIKLRIGIHSGRVVAGEMGAGASREEFAVVGMTPNIASRLENLAPENGVVVSADLKRLIEADFSFESLGPKKLKGITEPIEVFRLTGPERSDVGVTNAPAHDYPLSGRDQEMQALLDAWNEVCTERKAALAFVSGEPGIGKTGLASLFLKSAPLSSDKVLVMACSAYDQDAPFGPVVRMLAGELGLSLDRLSTQPDSLMKDRIIADAKETDRETLETLFRLLWRDPTLGTKPVLEGLAERRELLRALIQYLTDREGPLLLLLEDAHWADPSTVELIDRILRHAKDLPILVLALSRPGNSYPFDDLPATRLHLTGLQAAACELIVRRLTDGKPLERHLLDRLMSITGGVPLFVEELTKSLLEGGKLIERQGRLVMANAAPDLDTPVTILDLLTSRLDALGSAKILAQAASVIGRSFSFDALTSVSKGDRSLIRRDLDRLILADFVIVKEDAAKDRGVKEADAKADSQPGSFEFRHALYQKAAYDSLLRSNRQQLHGRHLAWLESDAERLAATPPERLAFYSQQAGFLDNAVAYWIEAGEEANRASASQEAVHHFKAGLRALEDLPKTEDNRRQGLRLLTLLGGSLMMSHGPGAPETREIYDQAVALCKGVKESPWHFPAYWGWWRVSRNFTVMLKRAERLVAVARGMKEQEFSLQARHCNWVNAFMVGDHKTCLRHACRGIEIYDKGKFADMGSLYGGHDPKVCGLGEIALSKWLIGEADQALDHVERSLAWAETIEHLGSRLHALDIALMLHHYRRDVEAVTLLASELKTLAETHELDDYRAKSLIFEGWCLTEKGDLGQGLERLEDGFAIMREQGTHEDFPVYFSMVADCRRRMGDGACALRLLDEAKIVIENEGVTYWASEIYRHAAETLMVISPDEGERIDGYLDNAITLARAQKALALELRAVCARATRLRVEGAREEALASVKEVYGRFEEGFDTLDLQQARQHIEALEAAGVVPSHAD